MVGQSVFRHGFALGAAGFVGGQWNEIRWRQQIILDTVGRMVLCQISFDPVW